MTYQPEECVFGPPWSARLPSLLYLALALAVGAVVLLGESSSSNSKLFDFVVVQDQHRMMSMRTLAFVLLTGAVASVARAGMRGVRVYPDGVEAREIRNLVIPRVKRYRWPQMERIILDAKSSVALDLWDGRCEFLPQVSNRSKLEATLERVAAARAIPVRGGRGLDDVVATDPPERT
ncbi:MAG TPA: hypothetical protein VHM70_10540 [Polyangiaceae bacterium]|nr:hypothetical protein [Polyangiaceae bacterium]